VSRLKQESSILIAAMVARESCSRGTMFHVLIDDFPYVMSNTQIFLGYSIPQPFMDQRTLHTGFGINIDLQFIFMQGFSSIMSYHKPSFEISPEDNAMGVPIVEFFFQWLLQNEMIFEVRYPRF